MPTYEYRCKSCDHQFDIVQSFSDDALTECPSCHEPTLKKVFGNVGISFKGSGFYKTDSRSSGSSGGGSDQKAESSTDTKTSDTSSSDTKSSNTKSSDSTGTSEKKATTSASSS